MARQRKLSSERKELIQGLLAHYKPGDTQDVQAMLRDLLGDTLQEMLEAEMDEHLGYSKYDYDEFCRVREVGFEEHMDEPVPFEDEW